jgi:hypothetical protein
LTAAFPGGQGRNSRARGKRQPIVNSVSEVRMGVKRRRFEFTRRGEDGEVVYHLPDTRWVRPCPSRSSRLRVKSRLLGFLPAFERHECEYRTHGKVQSLRQAEEPVSGCCLYQKTKSKRTQDDEKGTRTPSSQRRDCSNNDLDGQPHGHPPASMFLRSYFRAAP